jgi:hypothetical protein
MSPYLYIGMEATPRALERLMRAIPEARWDEEALAGRFTPREVIAHLAEWEPIMRDRVRSAVDEPGSTVRAFDEGRLALEGRYSESEPFERLTAFSEERRETLAYLKSLGGSVLQRSAIHPERGIQTAEDFANTFLGHDLYHLEQLTFWLE